MRRFVLTSGSGNSILRSTRPGRSSAGSRLSMRFVARITCGRSRWTVRGSEGVARGSTTMVGRFRMSTRLEARIDNARD
eukprot:1179196-Prorocentrum_minimum.AAC.5